MKKKTNDSIKSKYIFILVMIFCFVLILLTFTTDVVSGPFKRVAELVIVPVQEGFNQIGTWITDKGVYFQDSADIYEENQALQKKVDRWKSVV